MDVDSVNLPGIRYEVAESCNCIAPNCNRKMFVGAGFVVLRRAVISLRPFADIFCVVVTGSELADCSSVECG